MEEDECAKMLVHLQQYVPHLEKLIAQLKDPKRKNRELQLNKLEGLHSMITDRKKKLKLDTLKKCEDVILKILHKVHPNVYKKYQPLLESSQFLSNMKFLCKDPPERQPIPNISKQNHQTSEYLRFQAARARLSEISTPASPSPPRDIPLLHKPITIPTEKIKKIDPNPDEFYIKNWENTFDVNGQKISNHTHAIHMKHEKPDVYSQARESLSSSKKIVFDRLGTKVDMSVPPLSAEDLELLTFPDDDLSFDDASGSPTVDNFSMDQLQDLREVLQQKLQNEMRKNMPDLRNKLNSKEGTSKYKDKQKKESKTVAPATSPSSSTSSFKCKSPRIEKVFKDPDSKFGNLLSSIDDRILGDTPATKKKEKKDQSKDEKLKTDSKRNEDSKESKKHSNDKKDSHSNDKKSHRDEKKDHKSHKKDKSRSKSKDKDSEKHKSDHSDKSKDTAKYSEKNNTGEKSSKVNEGNEEHINSLKFDLSISNTKFVNAEQSVPKIEQKEAPVYKRLADKYNPRPRKNSLETVNKMPVEDNRKLVDTGQQIQVLDNIFSSNFMSKESTRCETFKSVDSRPSDPRQMNDPRSMNDVRYDPRQINNCHQMNDSHYPTDPRQLIEPKLLNNPRQNVVPSWFGPNSPNFESAIDKPNLLGRSPLLKTIPPHQSNSSMTSPLLPNPTTSNSLQMGYPTNNPAIRQNEMIPSFVPPPQNIINQNPGGNTYMNTFIVQNNLSSNLAHNQFNVPQNTFHAPPMPNKAFHPYDPIDSSEYDLSKMQPTDFYSPTFSNVKRPILSPPPTPTYPSHHGPSYPTQHSQQQYPSRERSSYVDRSNVDSWPSEGKPQWGDRRYAREREESHKGGVPSRDPRIRAREMKDRPDRSNYSNRESSSTIQSRRKSVDERTFYSSQNKYDSLYSNLDRPKEKETFISPLDSLYTVGEERVQKTGKGYGIQNFRIPKKKSETVDKQLQKDHRDEKRDGGSEDDEKSHDQERNAQKQDIPPALDKIKKEVDISTEGDDEVQKDSKSVSENKKEKESLQEEVASTSLSAEVKKSLEECKASETEESMLANFLTKLITKSEKKELLSAIFSTLTDNVSDQQKKKFKRIQQIVDSDSDDEKEETVNKTENSNLKTESSESNIQPKEKPNDTDSSKRKVKSNGKVNEDEATEDEAEATEEEVDVEVTEEKNESSDSDDDSDDNVLQAAKTRFRKIIKKKGQNKKQPVKKTGKKIKGVRSTKVKQAVKQKVKAKNKKVVESKSPTPVDDNVIETVGERIKNRRRNVKPTENSDVPKPRKCRTELDMLHDDIKEMFIRDGVLTASGKRMCRMLKPEPEADLSSKMCKTRSSTSLEDEISAGLDSMKCNAKNLKVMLEKADLTKHTSQPANDSGSDSEPLENRLLKRSKSRMGRRNRENSSSTTTSDASPSSVKRTRGKKSKPIYTEETDEEPPRLSEAEIDLPEENTNETEAVEAIDTSTETPLAGTDIVTSKKGAKKKRRVQTWASGIIKKRKRKPSSNPTTPTPSIDGDQHSTTSDLDEPSQNDNENELEYIEPDKDYYFEPQEKSVCKVCPFKGKFIVQHYKTVHPRHEVLISRISPENAKKAMDEAIEKEYDIVEVPDVVDLKMKRKRYTYQCRFCQASFKNENSESFFDHLTSHTGEYRFWCNFCSFKTATSKALRSHFHTSHSSSIDKGGIISPAYPASPDYHLVFGYICGDCNFIQMDKSAVTTHSKIYHLSENPKIYKINMSVFEEELLPLKSTLEVSNEEEKQIKKEELDIQPAQSATELIAATDDLETADKLSVEPEIDNEVSNVSETTSKEEDPTVFKNNIDYVQENMILEEEKHEKMKEINLTIIPRKKFGSNLLDKIRSRLEDKIGETAIDPTEPCDIGPALDENITIQNDFSNETVVKSVRKSEKNSEHSEMKKFKSLEPKINSEQSTEKPINNKSSVPITNIIERLQGKLNVDLAHPPPLIPLNEFNLNLVEPKTEDLLLQVGPVAASKKNSYILYICYMQSCMFSSTSESEFEIHCTTLHCNEGWDGFCNICNSKIGSFEVVKAFKHLLDVHKNEITPKNIVIKTEPIEPENQTKMYIRMRRLSGDKLSEVHSEASESSSDHKSESNESSTDGKANISFQTEDVAAQSSKEEEKVTEASHNFPFQITNVVSLADNTDDTVNDVSISDVPASVVNPLPSLTIINSQKNSPSTATTSIAFQLPLQTTTGATSYSLVLPVLTPISKSLIPVGKLSPTKITACSRKPTYSPTLKSYSSVKTQPLKIAPKKIMLKDTPLQPEELGKSRKSALAMACLMVPDKLVQLYKCPEKYCSFSTDSKKAFEVHLTKHIKYTPGALVSCLYCNFKTNVEYYGVHCDIRHGRCQFCCAYCFYRAINQCYVEIHQEREHPCQKRRVYMVGINQDALMSHAQIQMPALQTIVPLYTCGQLGCDKKFILGEDFREHLLIAHCDKELYCSVCNWSPKSPDCAVLHMQLHGIYYYHCRYCAFGGINKETVYKHLANLHFALQPKIVSRAFVQDDSAKPAVRFDDNNPISLEYLEILSEELAPYFTLSARVSIPPKQNSLIKPPLKSSTTPPVSKMSPEPKDDLTSVLKKIPKRPNISVKIIEESTVIEEKINDLTALDKENNDNDNDVVILSDDETTSVVTNLFSSLQAAKNVSADNENAKNPVVLNKYLPAPTNILNLDNDIGSCKDSTKDDTKSTATVSMSTMEVLPTTNKSDFLLIEPATVNVDESLIDLETTNASSCEVDPLQLDSEACISEANSVSNPTENTFSDAKLETSTNYGSVEEGEVQEFSDLTPDEDTFSTQESMKKQGLMGKDLFRCGICRAGFYTSSNFKTHVTKCIEINKNGAPRPFKCAHCIKGFKSLGTLLDHVRLHGTLRFSCSLCDFKHQHQLYVRSHLKSRHKITSVLLTPVDPAKHCIDEDEFVFRPKIGRQKSIDGASGSKDSAGNSADESFTNGPSKASYGPDEIASVPIRPIFNKEIKCSACGYLTKVRANLIRHLQFHTTGKEMHVPVSAPVNPVPCLEKNEKMFDKMTNLSLSSYNDSLRLATKVEKLEKPGLSKEEEAQLPGFVPINKRYVCGANLCDYLCLEESMLRYHLQALHSNESFYKCMHCEDKLSSDKGVINVEFIIKHLRLHDLHLYKCRYCKFVHHLKNKVDRHVTDKHPDKPPVVVIVRELEQEPEDPQEHDEIVKEGVAKEAKPWRCGMCKYRCTNKEEIVSHAFNKHDVDIQFKCPLCQFTSHTKSTFSDHFETDHPGQNIDVIDAYYEVGETVTSLKGTLEGPHFDTTPLWQRDKNKFKHIRGIPLDESKFPKKSPMKVVNSSDNLDKAIEAVASGTSQIIGKDIVKNSLPKKPKTLKEKKMEIKILSENEVIEIEDEEEKNMLNKVGVVARNLFNRRTSEVNKPTDCNEKQPEPKLDTTRRKSFPELMANDQNDSLAGEEVADISLQEIEEMDLETLKNTELTGTYGPFGKPFYKQFLCPLCSTFKTKRGEALAYHLYKELHYYRFVCTNCALTGITYSFLHKHSLKKHLTESIHPISPNPSIEQWVEKVLAIQRRIIGSNSALGDEAGTSTNNESKSRKRNSENSEPESIAKEVVADTSSNSDSENSKLRQSPLMHKCQHCSYTCKSASDMRKHEKRHWVQKPLKCGYCDIEGVTKYEIIQHAKRAHPASEPLVIPVAMPITPTIRPISRKRKYPKSSTDNPNNSEEVTAKLSSSENDETSEIVPEVTNCKSFTFMCDKCSELCNTENEMKLHWEAIHHIKTAAIKFTKLPNFQLEDLPDTVEISFTEEDHDEKEIVFICQYCPKRCYVESDLRAHWEITHKAKQPAFKYKKIIRSELTKKGSLNYKCCYCDFIGHLEVIKKHFNVKHPNMSVSAYRYKCGYCTAYFKIAEKCKTHCTQKHLNVEPLCLNITNPNEDIKQEEKLKEFMCEFCLAEFDLRKQLVEHHEVLHSHLELNLPPELATQTSVQAEGGDEMKNFKCPQCQHSSNSYAAMRDHLRNHVKPYQCFYCKMRFTYPSLAKVHHSKEHPNTEFKCVPIEEANKQNEELRKNLLILTKDGTYAKMTRTKGVKRRKSEVDTQPPKIRLIEDGADIDDTSKTINANVKVSKPTARKSTTQGTKHLINEEFSYYGNKPDVSGLENVKTTVSFMDSMVTMNINQFRGFLNISPTVPVVDVMKYRNEL